MRVLRQIIYHKGLPNPPKRHRFNGPPHMAPVAIGHAHNPSPPHYKPFLACCNIRLGSYSIWHFTVHHSSTADNLAAPRTPQYLINFTFSAKRNWDTNRYAMDTRDDYGGDKYGRYRTPMPVLDPQSSDTIHTTEIYKRYPHAKFPHRGMYKAVVQARI